MSGSRERMLSRIRTGLEQARPMLEREAALVSHDPPAFVHPPEADLAEQFAQELTRLECMTYLCPSEASALEVISQILTQHSSKQVLAWDMAQINLAGLTELLAQHEIQLHDIRVADNEWADQLQKLEKANVCISGADVGIAESASIVLRGGPGRPRLASLLAPIYIAVLRRSQLVRGLGEAIDRLRAQYPGDLFADASSLTLISGPSRTADIELTLTLGVHGPREVHAIIIG